MRARLVVLFFAAFATFSATAAAHDLGYSTSDFDVGPGGIVDARFTFAAADLAQTNEVDFLAKGIELRADDTPCAGTVDRYEPTGADGIDVRVTFHCPANAHAMELTLFLLEDLRETHRNVARLTAGPRTAQAILSPKSRTLRLQLVDAPPPTIQARSPLLWLGLALMIALAAYALRRRRS
ncbi:hypothetical protein BH09MYX1_BH09MYX1_39410 [soil metagenome]